MSRVEPSPLVMGAMGLPSTEGTDGLAFFAAARSSAGANRLPLTAPSADRNERRFQPDFKFMRSSLSMSFVKNYSPAGGVGGVTTMALPTISISESPGIHAIAMQARDGAFPEQKEVP